MTRLRRGEFTFFAPWSLGTPGTLARFEGPGVFFAPPPEGPKRGVYWLLQEVDEHLPEGMMEAASHHLQDGRARSGDVLVYIEHEPLPFPWNLVGARFLDDESNAPLIVGEYVEVLNHPLDEGVAYLLRPLAAQPPPVPASLGSRIDDILAHVDAIREEVDHLLIETRPLERALLEGVADELTELRDHVVGLVAPAPSPQSTAEISGTLRRLSRLWKRLQGVGEAAMLVRLIAALFAWISQHSPEWLPEGADLPPW